MINHTSTRRFAASRTMAAAAIIATMFLAGSPAMAARDKDQTQDQAEARVKDLHAKLNITTAEEDQWAKVAKVMRDNAKELDQLSNERAAKAKDMDAVDDLKSYGEIAEAHADGVKKLTPVFATLYDSMSKEQQSKADELFRNGPQLMGHHHKKS